MRERELPGAPGPDECERCPGGEPGCERVERAAGLDAALVSSAFGDRPVRQHVGAEPTLDACDRVRQRGFCLGHPPRSPFPSLWPGLHRTDVLTLRAVRAKVKGEVRGERPVCDPPVAVVVHGRKTQGGRWWTSITRDRRSASTAARTHTSA